MSYRCKCVFMWPETWQLPFNCDFWARLEPMNAICCGKQNKNKHTNSFWKQEFFIEWIELCLNRITVKKIIILKVVHVYYTTVEGTSIPINLSPLNTWPWLSFFFLSFFFVFLNMLLHSEETTIQINKFLKVLFFSPQKTSFVSTGHTDNQTKIKPDY